ncbi:MAG: hypothetical protein H6905_10490 [Hyphomicrobiales bacterium]|nr:hypothetical protein [Hyphomicrobiales bacterium]
MDWSEQTNQMMKAWTDAQSNMMSGWMQMAQGGSPFRQSMPFFDPSQFFKMGVDTWSGGHEGAAQRFAGNLFGTPDIMMRSVNLLMKAWQTVAPKIDQGADWKSDLSGLIEKWQKDVMGLPGRQMQTANEFADLTKTLFEQWTPVTGPWLSMVTQAMGAGHPGAAFMGGTQGMGNMFNFGEMFPMTEGVGEMPRATVMREKMGKMLKVADAASDLQKAQSVFNAAMSEHMGKAVERTIEHLASLAEKGEPITSVRDLMRTWFGIADKTLNEAFMSDEFLAKQADMTKALLKFKVTRRDALEMVYDSMELPTRSSIDEAYRDIHALKREVRQLRKALADATKAPAARGGRKAGAAKAASTETDAS